MKSGEITMSVANDVSKFSLAGSKSSNPLRCTVRSILLASVVVSVVACAPSRNVAYDPVRPAEVMLATPTLMIKKDIDLVRLEGVLGSAQQVARVTALAAELFGAEMVINDLKTDLALGDAEWLGAVLQTAETMQDIDGFSLIAGSGHMTVGGSVDTHATASQIAQMASDLAGRTLAVSSTLSYPIDTSTPNMMADVDADVVSVVPATGISVEVVPLAALEQQAVAVQQASLQSIPAVAMAQTPESVIVVPASMQQSEFSGEIDADTDGDGIADIVDGCESRPGYPVNERGCQSLDGYLKDVRFYGDSDQLTDAAKGALDIIAFTMLDHPVSKIAVLSYSKDGAPTLMRTQARQRAHSVVDYLIAKGVDQSRLQAFALAHRQGTTDHILIKEVD